jgi:hypothetical protein
MHPRPSLASIIWGNGCKLKTYPIEVHARFIDGVKIGAQIRNHKGLPGGFALACLGIVRNFSHEWPLKVPIKFPLLTDLLTIATNGKCLLSHSQSINLVSS